MPQTTTQTETISVEDKVASATSLYKKVEAWGDGNTGKTRIGYTVSAYNQALKALQKLQFIPDQENPTILGKKRSYQQVQGMEFDANGFSIDRDAAIWKMQFRQWGAVPLLSSQTQRVCIAGTGKQTDETRQRNECPFSLNKNHYTEQSFNVGVKVDLTDLGVAYFNDMFCSRGQDDEKINSSNLAGLVNSGCLFVEIIFPKANSAGFAGIIGQANISNNATIYLNSCILACQGWDKFGLRVQGSAGANKIQIAPNPSTYKFPIDNATYNLKQSSITKFGRTQYNSWCNRSASAVGDVPVMLYQPQSVQVFVRFYIPSEFRQNAEFYLPNNYSHNIYKTYGDLIRQSMTVGRTQGGSAAVSIKAALDNWRNMIYNERNISTRQFNPNSLRYVLGAGHTSFKYQGENGSVKFSVSGETSGLHTPLFIHTGTDPHQMDCSSFSCCLIYDSGIFDETKTLPSFATSGFQNAANQWKPLLKPQYDVIDFPLDDTNQVQAGDIVYFRGDEKGSAYGHAAVVYNNQPGSLETLEINTGKRYNLKVWKQNMRRLSEYNHVIRFIDKPQNT